jgi:hypothetical protein
MEICQIFLHRITVSDQGTPGKMSGRRKPSLSPIRPDTIFEKLCGD